MGRTRSYLIVGGDRVEREYVAGNVARAAGCRLDRVELGSHAHACEAIGAIATYGRKPAQGRSVAFFDNADAILAPPDASSGCGRCAALQPGGVRDALNGLASTVVLAVRELPRETDPPRGWRPETVIYLANDPIGAAGLKASRSLSVIHRGRLFPTATHQIKA